MGTALFYHLIRSPAETLVPVLVERALAQGWRVELRAADPARADRFDDLLWQREGFLPHGRAGGPHDDRQPVLLTVAGDAAPNGAACIVAIDGAEIAPAEIGAASRTCYLFDGSDPAAVEVARDRWRQIRAAGQEAEYWTDASGGWVRQATSGGHGS